LDGSGGPAGRPEASKFTEEGVRDYERRRYRGIDQRIVHARETRLIRKCFDRIRATHGLPEGGAAVLDLPCGYGRFTDLLRAYAGRLVASDLSFEMVRRAVHRPGPAVAAVTGRAAAGVGAAAARAKGRAFGSPLARDLYPRASTAEVDPRAKPGGPDDPVDSVVKDDLVVADVADAVERLVGAVANAKQGLPFKAGVFDVVFSVRFFHHVHDPLDRARILREFRRATAGWVIVSFYRMNGLHGLQRRLRRKFHKSRTHIKMIEPGTFEKEAAAAGFEVVRVFPLFRGIHAYHLALLKK
jgi:SAM-dependent methyltransferase